MNIIKLYIIRPEKYMFKTKIINAADYFSTLLKCGNTILRQK